MQLGLKFAVPIVPFDWKWSECNPERFSQAWEIVAQLDGNRYRLRHGLDLRAHCPARRAEARAAHAWRRQRELPRLLHPDPP